jgi:hypothetical protein
MNKNLVIVRAGDSSLHPTWKSSNQNFDIAVSYYGKDSNKFAEDFKINFVGTKFHGIYDSIISNQISIENYNYIWLPDDDISTTGENINKMFDIMQEFNLILAQPALYNNDYYSHITTLKIDAFRLRYTNFVEIMAPCLSKEFFKHILPTMMENRSGWGLDFLWPVLAGPMKTGIIDSTPVWHTRPVGRDYSWLGVNPKKEGRQLMQKYNLSNSVKNLHGVLHNNTVVDLSKRNMKEYIKQDEYELLSMPHL